MTERFNPLRSSAQTAALIAEVTGDRPETVLQRLRAEYENPGETVAADFRARGLAPHLWSDGLIRFYGETDAFLYELAVWNNNTIKRRMRRWIRRRLSRHSAAPLEILSIGDGLGFDSLYLALGGHRVSYFELPGYGEAFARLLFKRAEAPVRILTDTSKIPRDTFGAVVCLDVLEHVPDPPAMVAELAGYLRPGGLLFVNSPFYMIAPAYPTHLRSNRRFSGDLSLYRDNGLELIDARPWWDPLVLRKSHPSAERTSTHHPAGPPPGMDWMKSLVVRAAGLLLRGGRHWSYPLAQLHRVRRLGNRWFDD